MTRPKRPEPAPGRRRPGRVEAALGTELRSGDLPAGARAHLRYLAALCDAAERFLDVDGGAKIGRAYLDARAAYGLAGGNREPLDPFAAFVAGLSAPAVGDAPDA